jgi:hypothetical protein
MPTGMQRGVSHRGAFLLVVLLTAMVVALMENGGDERDA